MGQNFYACAYDTETKTCCVIGADKFHANCYSYSGAVLSMHYLLRQKPYRIMWGGRDVLADEAFENFSRSEDLLGLSTYLDYKDFEWIHDDLKNKSYYGKVKLIGDNHKLWKKIDVWDEAINYFDRENNQFVNYGGYLLNHTQKLAVDLADYFKRSKFLSRDGNYMAIDAVPVLTETGGGTIMALFDGVSADSTEDIACTWNGDLLQITDELPKDYEILNCCIAEIWSRAKYCYSTFGVLDVNGDSYVLNDDNGKLFEGAALNVFGKRGLSSYIKVESAADEIKFIPVDV